MEYTLDLYLTAKVDLYEYIPEIGKWGPFNGSMKVSNILELLNRGVNVGIDQKHLDSLLKLSRDYNDRIRAWNDVCSPSQRMQIADKVESILMKRLGIAVEESMKDHPLHIPKMPEETKPKIQKSSHDELMKIAVAQQKSIYNNEELDRRIRSMNNMVSDSLQQMIAVPEEVVKMEDEMNEESNMGYFNGIKLLDD